VQGHKYRFELEVTPDRYTQGHCRLLYCSYHSWKGEDNGYDVVND
jgi:hypothetical protein